MTKEEYEAALIDLNYRTPSLEMFREMEEYDDNVVWRMETGHLVNLLDAALEEVDRLNAGRRMERSTEWGVKDPWGMHPVAEGFEKSRQMVKNMRQAGHQAQIIWRGVTRWMAFGSDEPVDG